VGVECFLRRTLPELSLLHLWNLALGVQAEITFEPGNGFGHWLGYLGGGLMMLPLLYPLRSRLGRFQGVSARTWLRVHVWVGLAGAAFTTYHSILKLDRWVAVPLVASWLVVLSGLIGWYLYGVVHSGLGLAEFEKRALEMERRRLLAQWSDSQRAATVLAAEESKDRIKVKGFLIVVVTLMWRDLVGWLRYLWRWHFGLRHIDDVQLRQQMARLLLDLDRNQRSQLYLEGGKRLLSVWNKIHLVLTALMFALSILVFAFLYKAH
jgi:hypothetical protein